MPWPLSQDLYRRCVSPREELPRQVVADFNEPGQEVTDLSRPIVGTMALMRVRAEQVPEPREKAMRIARRGE